MKYTSILLFSLAFTISSCANIDSNAQKSTSKLVKSEEPAFNKISSDTLYLINSYVTDQHNLKHVNPMTLDQMKLKQQVKITFNIPELKNVSDNEPELAGLLRLAWTRENPILLFAALTEEVVGEKKPYKVLLRPLILYLIRTYRAFDDATREEYHKYFIAYNRTSVEVHLARTCLEHGHYDLLFELFEAELSFLQKDFVAKFEDPEVFTKIFGDYPARAAKYLNVLLTDNKNRNPEYDEDRFGRWISKCIINGLPQSYYIVLFDNNPIVLEHMIDHLFLSTNIPESEYERIHSQVSDHLKIYSDDLKNISYFNFFRMINDIRFGSFDLNDFKPTVGIRKNMLEKLAKAALLANKRELFAAIYERYGFGLGDNTLDKILYFKNLKVNHVQAKNFKMIFDRINVYQYMFQNDLNLIYFMMQFYAIERIIYDDNSVFTFNFVVSEHLLDYDFPPVITITIKNSHGRIFTENILKKIEIFNEKNLTSLIQVLVEYSIKFPISHRESVYEVSTKVLESISRLPELMKFMVDNEMKLIPQPYDVIFKNFFEIYNIDYTLRLFNWNSFGQLSLRELKTQDQIEKFEIVKGTCVAEMFLRWEDSYKAKEGHSKFLYFEWRSALAFWLKGPHRESIRQIRNPVFREMLRLDFPSETAELLEPAGTANMLNSTAASESGA